MGEWRCGWVRAQRSEQVGMWRRLIDVVTVAVNSKKVYMYVLAMYILW